MEWTNAQKELVEERDDMEDIEDIHLKVSNVYDHTFIICLTSVAPIFLSWRM